MLIAGLIAGLAIVPSYSIAFAQQSEVEKVIQGFKEVSGQVQQAFDKDVDSVLQGVQVGTEEESNDTGHGPIGNVSEPEHTVNNTGTNTTTPSDNGTGPVVIVDDNGTNQGNTTIPSEGGNDTQTVKDAKLAVSINFANDNIKRGGAQVAFIATSDSNNNNAVVSNASITGVITYPSGFSKTFEGQTNDIGTFVQPLKIGHAVKTGEFKVDVSATAINQTASDSKSFSVEKANGK